MCRMARLEKDAAVTEAVDDTRPWKVGCGCVGDGYAGSRDTQQRRCAFLLQARFDFVDVVGQNRWIP